jgi:uncharacterized surface protein with fasciclin (FAS1) repeats
MNKIMRLIVSLFCVIVLFPQLASAKDETPKPAENVMKTIKGRKDLSKFAGLIEDTGLESVLESKEEHYTVFAPTNDALGNVPSDVMKRAKADKEHLKSFVKYHIISGSEVFFTNIRGRRAGPAAMSGETIMFEGTGKVVKVNDSGFVASDLSSANGVVHVMDAALIPPSIKEDPAKQSARMLEMMKPPEMPQIVPVKPSAVPAATPVTVPAATPVTVPTATPAVLPAGKSASSPPVAKSSDQSAGAVTGLPEEASPGQPAAKSGGKRAAKSGGQPAAKTADQPAATATGLSVETSTGLPAATSTGEPVVAPLAPPVPASPPLQEQPKSWWQKVLGK